jgi:hypothetical protein
MNRSVVWTICVMIAAGVALFDLVTAWALQINWLNLALIIGLFGIAVGLFVALVIAGAGERRRIRVNAHTSQDVVGPAARGARWSALAAAGLIVLLFANCSGSLTNGQIPVSGPMDDASNFLKVSAATVLPLLLVIALTAALATAAQVLSSRRLGRPALRAAQAGVWSSVIFIAVAFGTVPVGIVFGLSACDVGTSQGACMGGAATFMNVFAAATAALLLPYLTLVASALDERPIPAPADGLAPGDPGVQWNGTQWLSGDRLWAWNGSRWLRVGSHRPLGGRIWLFVRAFVGSYFEATRTR